MTRSQRKEWGDYLRSVIMGTLFSVPALGFAPNFFVHVSLPLKAVIWGWTFGTLIYLAKNVTARIHFRSFFLTILAQSIPVLVALVIAFAICFDLLLALELRRQPLDIQIIHIIGGIFANLALQLSILGAFIAVVIFSGFFQISRKMGPGVLRNWMLGKYHEPHEEERIFMFLDMKDSTTLAEKLGAIRFSALVRDFFADLTEPVIETRAEISHYIGDEAVLTWSVKNGVDDSNCLRLFEMFKDRLANRAGHYEKTYGLVPEFKAGAHIGPVVATEVGVIKSEIVFHGDVLNTAARIQGMCNSLAQEFLISGELRAKLPSSPELHSLGRHLLKGKEHDVEIFAVLVEGAPIPAPIDAPKEPEPV